MLDTADLQRPSAARIYDYFLGGFHNFAIDRAVAQKFMEVLPDAPLYMRANRTFLRRVVRFLAENQSIDQFLDLGSGLPVLGNVHQIAQEANPLARTAYVDNERIAVRYSKTILKDNAITSAILCDMRDSEGIIDHPEVQRLLDLSKPMAVLLFSALLFLVDDEEAYGVVRDFRDALAPGSYVAISHPTGEGLEQERVAHAETFYTAIGTPVKLRSPAQVEKFFEGLELVEPGLVYAPLWHPESKDELFLDHPERSGYYVGVGRKL